MRINNWEKRRNEKKELYRAIGLAAIILPATGLFVIGFIEFLSYCNLI